eukprot:CAMPEP_0194267696 /NCGR_PEP_ID=MMETSP0169-20130528/2158_1 /TAXON_ID=218684 /ORGANISM="Corethron pennatum, Strain L29A3" /LENGTH=452 /DNA_ID=CAMNT_0039008637 /DNA_START=91 /DNA_END=1446 /DNA_ORIENTATION=+
MPSPYHSNAPSCERTLTAKNQTFCVPIDSNRLKNFTTSDVRECEEACLDETWCLGISFIKECQLLQYKPGFRTYVERTSGDPSPWNPFCGQVMCEKDKSEASTIRKRKDKWVHYEHDDHYEPDDYYYYYEQPAVKDANFWERKLSQKRNIVNDCGGRTPNLVNKSQKTNGCKPRDNANVKKATRYGTAYVKHFSSTYGTDFSYFGANIIQNVNYGKELQGVYSVRKKQAFYGGPIYPDLVGHELTHGIVQSYGVFFPYQFESGALEEAFCDIFGAVLKRKNGSTGADIWSKRGGQEYMNNPSTSSYNDWKKMEITNDYGGVHENSGIVSLVFVRLSKLIGFKNAEQIFYDTLAGCLSAHSNFCATRFCTIDAARDDIMKSHVEDAWDTVGLTADCDPDLYCKTNSRSQSKKRRTSNTGRILKTTSNMSNIKNSDKNKGTQREKKENSNMSNI